MVDEKIRKKFENTDLSYYDILLKYKNDIEFLTLFYNISFASIVISKLSKEEVLDLMSRDEFRHFLEYFFIREPKYIIDFFTKEELVKVLKNGEKEFQREMFYHILNKRDDYEFLFEEDLHSIKISHLYRFDMIRRNGRMREKGKQIQILKGVKDTLQTPKDFYLLFSESNRYIEETMKEVNEDESLKQKLIEFYPSILKDYCTKTDVFFFLNATRNLSEIQKIVEENKKIVFSKLFTFKEEVGLIDGTFFKIYELLVDELLEAAKISIQDIEYLKRGSYSSVYKIGEYVLKVSNERLIKEIPYHKRILYPLFRKQINEKGSYVEIYPYVTPVMPGEKAKSNVLSIYKELRDDGIIWYDPRVPNIGILEKENVPTLGENELFVSPDSIDFKNYRKEKPLQKGDIVILDVDALVYEKDFDESLLDKNSPSYWEYRNAEDIYQLNRAMEIPNFKLK